jgi:hypothetical protein
LKACGVKWDESVTIDADELLPKWIQPRKSA